MYDTYKSTEVFSEVSQNSEIEQLYAICVVMSIRKEDALALGLYVEMRLDYIQMNYTEVLEFDVTKGSKLVILSGALYVDKTRLIDNILLGDAEKIFQ